MPTVDYKPFYAVAGAGDLAVEKIRQLSKLAQDRLATIDTDQSAITTRVQTELETRADELTKQAKAISDRAQAAWQDALGQANETYVALAGRGESLVGRIRNQASTKQLEDQAETTVRSAKATVTSVKKAATSARTRAKSTATSARKTAESARKAAGAAADKVGD
ncbi:hypothetical protein [Tenggerimyces flavus]|uniref:Uncharacterized protein n=1 Tax=Tenggerimyces flavus TaxID=1708749 RepID=A0ABV7YCJ3_9ACTN|nr:hypothetical protein [Tenggerimyces flavus]MBM7783800.1 ElaB/YqjD/DUF883 family membrane-anchored ribosome-binding protein [Tenggerimyces flavus]